MLSLAQPRTSLWQVSSCVSAYWVRRFSSPPHWAYRFPNLRLAVDSSEGNVNIPQVYIPQHPVKKEKKNTMTHQEALWTQPEKLLLM